MINTKQVLPALVWGISGFLLIIYAIIGFSGKNIPSITTLVEYLSNIDDKYIYFALALAIFIEGTYIIGNFFPGSSIIVLLILTKVIESTSTYFLVIFLIFASWSFAGILNISIGKIISKYTNNNDIKIKKIESNKWITWFPAFRANYEVSQAVEGYCFKNIFLLSTKIKFTASLVMMIVLYLLSYVINVDNLNSEEGFFTLVIVGIASLTVSYFKLKERFDNGY